MAEMKRGMTAEVQQVMLDLVRGLARGEGRSDIEQRRRMDYLLLHAPKPMSADAAWAQIERLARDRGLTMPE